MLWEMASADGEIHEFEENVVKRIADLLGVSGAPELGSGGESRI